MLNELFSCKRCGYCCHGDTTVSLDADDQERMLKVLGVSRQEALKRYWRDSGSQIQMKTVDGHCVFYDNGCSIHPGRPWRCRQWPFVEAIEIDESNYRTISSTCPGFSEDADYLEVCRVIARGGFLKKEGKSKDSESE